MDNQQTPWQEYMAKFGGHDPFAWKPSPPREKAPEEIVLARLTICEACPLFDKKSDKEGYCTNCGCEMHDKASYSHDSCPKAKWGYYMITGDEIVTGLP